MSAAEIPDMGGEFLLCYYSNNLQSIVGISQPFQVTYLEDLIGIFISFAFCASGHRCVQLFNLEEWQQ